MRTKLLAAACVARVRVPILGARRGLPPILMAISILALLAEPPAFANPQSGATAAPAVATEPPVNLSLRLKETAVLPSGAPNAFLGTTKCDSSGDIFLQLVYIDSAHGRLAQDPAVSEIIPDSKRIVESKISPQPSSDYPNPILVSFNVKPNGVLYALIFTQHNTSSEGSRPTSDFYIERFKDDGTMDSISHLDAPPNSPHWFPMSLGTFSDGNFLISGSIRGGAEQSSANSRRPFTAVYDPSGRFVQEVTLPDNVAKKDEVSGDSVPQNTTAAPKVPPATNAVQSPGTGKGGTVAQAEAQASSASAPMPRDSSEANIGGLANGPDGNVWVLRLSDPLQLYAVDSSGEVMKHFQFASPVQGLKPLEFGFAGPGQIFLNFLPFPGNQIPQSGPTELLGLFDMASERFDALYALPDAGRGLRTLACSDRRGGFLYVGATPDHFLAEFDYRP